ncbi:MAG: right-handed parallel beta-helix repeat-containing protein, partial [Bacteroidota bacterium]
RLAFIVLFFTSVLSFGQVIVTNGGSTDVNFTVNPNSVAANSLLSLQLALMPDTFISVQGDIDLGSSNIVLPSNCKLVDGGGSITNGTITFADRDSEIEDSLVHYTVDYVNGHVSDYKYVWNPANDGMTEGVVDSLTAQTNKVNWNTMVEKLNGLQAWEVVGDNMDVYFSVWSDRTDSQQAYDLGYPAKIMANTHYKWGPNTFFRVQPSNSFGAKLFVASRADNTTWEGGNLIGDRWEHNYAPVTDYLDLNRDTHEYGANLAIVGCEYFTLKDTYIAYGHGDGIGIGITEIRHNGPSGGPNGSVRAGAAETTNFKIENVTVYQCRRNNVSVVDARSGVFENCKIIGTGAGFPIQTIIDYQTNGFDAGGVEPRCGIDVEPFRQRDGATGIEYLYEVTENIDIVNCIFEGNANTDITAFKGENVRIVNNKFDGAVNFNFGDQNVVDNNFFVANDTITGVFIGNNFVSGRTAITTNTAIVNDEGTTREIVIGQTITNNDIVGYDTGISLRGQANAVNNNRIRDFKDAAILLYGTRDGVLMNNFIRSEETNVDGIRGVFASWSNNVSLENNTIEITSGRGVEMALFNGGNDSINKVYYRKNKITAPTAIYLEDTYGHIFEDNDFSSTTIMDGDKTVSYISFIDNETLTPASAFIDHDGGPVRSWNIKGNEITVNGSADMININGDRFDSNDGEVIDVEILRNTFKNLGTGDGIDISSNLSVKDNLILHNRFEPTAGTGVDIRYSGNDSAIYKNALRLGGAVNTSITGTGNVTTDPQ